MIVRLAVLLAAFGLLAAGCGGSRESTSAGPSTDPAPAAGGGAAGSCALVVEYDGATYFGTAVEVEPPAGEPLGTGVVPACDDGGGAAPEEEVELVSIPGVASDVAVAWAGVEDTVFVRQDVQGIPPEIRRLTRPQSP